jgi:SAM-dependent methyltransferase
MMDQYATGELEFDLNTVFEVDDYMYFYRDSLTPEGLDEQAASLVKLLEMEPPMKVLDLACGFGRYANRLAALGYSVTGLDIMPGFLKIAREGAEAMGVRVNYLQGDMRQLDFDEAFDRVLILFTSFGYFSDEGNAQVLRNVARALKPGGLLGFDIPNRDLTLKVLPPYAVVEKEDDLMVNRNSFDTVTGRWHNRRIVIRDGVRKDKPFSIRLYNSCEIRDLLNNAGLEVYKMYGDWDGQTLSSDSRGIAIIARKPA